MRIQKIALLASICAVALVPAPSLQAGLFDTLACLCRGRSEPIPRTMKVLILHDQPGAVIETRGKYCLSDPHTGDSLATRFLGKKQYLQPISSGLKWGEEFPGLHQLKICPDEKGGEVYVDGKPYRGALYLYDIGGALSIVNEVPLETYLSTILDPAFDDETAQELLSAIAIVARTCACYVSDHPKNKFWYVDGRKIGYEGSSAIRPSCAMEKALAHTRSMVMSQKSLYEGVPETFPAQWGSMTGGKSSQEEAVFSHIALKEAEELAKQGKNAAQILNQAFPGATIELLPPRT